MGPESAGKEKKDIGKWIYLILVPYGWFVGFLIILFSVVVVVVVATAFFVVIPGFINELKDPRLLMILVLTVFVPLIPGFSAIVIWFRSGKK